MRWLYDRYETDFNCWKLVELLCHQLQNSHWATFFGRLFLVETRRAS